MYYVRMSLVMYIFMYVMYEDTPGGANVPTCDGTLVAPVYLPCASFSQHNAKGKSISSHHYQQNIALCS